jgi:cobalt/nickel transport system permease protein
MVLPNRADSRGFPFGCDARLKLGIVLAGWLVVLSARSPWGPLFVAIVAWGSLFCWRTSGRQLLRGLSAALFSGLVAVGLRVLLTRGEPAYELALLGQRASVSAQGLQEGARLGARILGAVALASWLAATTAWLDLQRALAWYRLPPSLLEIIELAHRYVAVLARAMETARFAQVLRLGYRDLRSSLACTAMLAGLLLGRAVDQAAATGQAMQLRGYRSLGPSAVWCGSGGHNVGLAALAIAFLGVAVLLSDTFS